VTAIAEAMKTAEIMMTAVAMTAAEALAIIVKRS
jgi:hypothetical protein